MSIIPACPPESEPAPAASAAQAELARRALYFMALMRETEDRIERKLYRQGKILGGVYVGRGQEAIPVGSALHSLPEDVLLPSHRDMAVFFIRGIPLGRIFAQYMGRADGLTRGRDGNMHMGDMSAGLVAIISALAASVPVAKPKPMATGTAKPLDANTAVTRPHKASVDPTDRSNAPATSRMVMPTAIML